jgi:3-oxoacyl-[acyl-carrier protein] reductase
MIDLNGLHVLVTGGSRGIGAATARLFGKAGATVMIQYREREAEAEALVDELLSISNRDHRRFPCDFSEPSEIVELFQFVASEWGKLDCLVNNAGVWQHNPMADFSGSGSSRRCGSTCAGRFSRCARRCRSSACRRTRA